MPALRSTSGLLLRTAGGAPVLRGPANLTAPAITRPPSGLSFAMSSQRVGWPGSNNENETLGTPRSWEANFADQNESFAGIRWCPTWIDAPAYAGTWMPAGGDVWRVTRKGDIAQDARTLVFYTSANPATVPPGDKVVLWNTSGPGDYGGATLNLGGYTLTLKAKMLVTGGQGSAYGDAAGQRVIEIDAGTELPAIDYAVPTFNVGGITRSTLQHRHWSFYADFRTKALRHPIGWLLDVSANSAMKNGGYIILGGNRWHADPCDWAREWNLLGASLTEELYAAEQAGLAEFLGQTDPQRLAVELEDEPVWPWASSGGQTGYGTLLRDVWLPLSRAAWGPERTIAIKPSGRAGLNSLIDTFDFMPAAGSNVSLAIHLTDGSIIGPSGPISLTDVGQSDWVCSTMRARMNTLGFANGGISFAGISSARVPDAWDRGQRVGRLLSSAASYGLHAFTGVLSDGPYGNTAVQAISGRPIEAFQRGISDYARRAGLMTV